MIPCFLSIRHYLPLACFLLFLFPYAQGQDQDSTQQDKVRVIVQVANESTMEPMAATVQAKMASNGHVIAIAKGDKDNGFQLNLPAGTVYMVEAQAEGYMISARELDLSRRPEAGQITLNLLMGNSGGYVQPNDIDAPITLVSSIYFEKNSVDVDSAGMSELKRIYILLRKNPEVKMVLLGHADVKGSIYRNVEVSELRSRQLRAILISNGIAPYRLSYYGYGNTQPASGRDEEDYLNNRVDFHLMF